MPLLPFLRNSAIKASTSVVNSGSKSVINTDSPRKTFDRSKVSSTIPQHPTFKSSSKSGSITSRRPNATIDLVHPANESQTEFESWEDILCARLVVAQEALAKVREENIRLRKTDDEYRARYRDLERTIESLQKELEEERKRKEEVTRTQGLSPRKSLKKKQDSDSVGDLVEYREKFLSSQRKVRALVAEIDVLQGLLRQMGRTWILPDSEPLRLGADDSLLAPMLLEYLQFPFPEDKKRPFSAPPKLVTWRTMVNPLTTVNPSRKLMEAEKRDLVNAQVICGYVRWLQSECSRISKQAVIDTKSTVETLQRKLQKVLASQKHMAQQVERLKLGFQPTGNEGGSGEDALSLLSGDAHWHRSKAMEEALLEIEEEINRQQKYVLRILKVFERAIRGDKVPHISTADLEPSGADSPVASTASDLRASSEHLDVDPTPTSDAGTVEHHGAQQKQKKTYERRERMRRKGSTGTEPDALSPAPGSDRPAKKKSSGLTVPPLLLNGPRGSADGNGTLGANGTDVEALLARLRLLEDQLNGTHHQLQDALLERDQLADEKSTMQLQFANMITESREGHMAAADREEMLNARLQELEDQLKNRQGEFKLYEDTRNQEFKEKEDELARREQSVYHREQLLMDREAALAAAARSISEDMAKFDDLKREIEESQQQPAVASTEGQPDKEKEKEKEKKKKAPPKKSITNATNLAAVLKLAVLTSEAACQTDEYGGRGRGRGRKSDAGSLVGNGSGSADGDSDGSGGGGSDDDTYDEVGMNENRFGKGRKDGGGRWRGSTGGGDSRRQSSMTGDDDDDDADNRPMSSGSGAGLGAYQRARPFRPKPRDRGSLEPTRFNAPRIGEKQVEATEKFKMPRSWEAFLSNLGDDKRNRKMPVRPMLKLINNMFLEKMESDAAADRDKAPRQQMSEFVIDAMMRIYGLWNLAAGHLREVMNTINDCGDRPRVILFGRFCGLFDPLPLQAVDFYLHSLALILRIRIHPTKAAGKRARGKEFDNAMEESEVSLQRAEEAIRELFSALDGGYVDQMVQKMMTAAEEDGPRLQQGRIEVDKLMGILMREWEDQDEQTTQRLKQVLEGRDDAGNIEMSVEDFIGTIRSVDPARDVTELDAVYNECKVADSDPPRVNPDAFVASCKAHGIMTFKWKAEDLNDQED